MAGIFSDVGEKDAYVGNGIGRVKIDCTCRVHFSERLFYGRCENLPYWLFVLEFDFVLLRMYIYIYGGRVNVKADEICRLRLG